jgi:hypothetical protein
MIEEGIIFPPLNRLAYPYFSVIQYANDTSVIIKVDVAQLLCLKSMLHTFVESTSLKINYHK